MNVSAPGQALQASTPPRLAMGHAGTDTISGTMNPLVKAGLQNNYTGVASGLPGGNAVTDQTNRGPDIEAQREEMMRMRAGAQMGNANPNNSALSGYMMGGGQYDHGAPGSPGYGGAGVPAPAQGGQGGSHANMPPQSSGSLGGGYGGNALAGVKEGSGAPGQGPVFGKPGTPIVSQEDFRRQMG